jgi:hypothetical protein
MKKYTRTAFLLLCVLGCSAAFSSASAMAQAQTPTATAIPTLTRNLSIGDSGADVFSLQTYLILNGFLHISTPTGYFGNLTAGAVQGWQLAEGLPSTGYFGPLSRAELAAIGNTFNDTSTSSTIATSTLLPTLSTSSFGLSVGDSLLGMNTTTLNAQLDAMASLGIGWIRFDIEWPDIQPNNSSTYDWTTMDNLVAAIRAHNLNALAILDYTPDWASTPGCILGDIQCAPASSTLFANYASAVVQRYAPQGISAWEIWNEPNTAQFWAPKADCAGYTSLLKAVYPVIKAAEPSSTVITGGLSPAATDGENFSPIDFLSCIYSNGGKNYFDAVGDHPYTYPYTPANDSDGAWNEMSETTPSLRSIMAANGDGAKKIWLTEFGAPTNGPLSQWYVSEASQTEMMTDAFTAYETYDWAGPLFWYTYNDSGSTTSTNENFFGLVRADGTDKPAYDTLKALIAAGL